MIYIVTVLWSAELLRCDLLIFCAVISLVYYAVIYIVTVLGSA